MKRVAVLLGGKERAERGRNQRCCLLGVVLGWPDRAGCGGGRLWAVRYQVRRQHLRLRPPECGRHAAVRACTIYPLPMFPALHGTSNVSLILLYVEG